MGIKPTTVDDSDLIDEEPETGEAANQAGHRFFTDADALRRQVEHEIFTCSRVLSRHDWQMG